MSTLHLDKLLDPASVVVIGASARDDSPGFKLTRNLMHGGFEGDLFLVNPRYSNILDNICYKSVKALPTVPDLAIILTPSRILRKTLVKCSRKGIRVAVVMSGIDNSQALHRYARRLGMRLLGPWCAGLIRPHKGLNASFSANRISKGSLAIVSQSASLGAAMLDWAETSNVGFSALLSTGQDTDVSLSDLLDLLAEDWQTKAVIVYVERVNNSRSLLSALSATARIKPVVLMRSAQEGTRYCDAQLRTGDVYSSDDVFQAALNRAGVVRIRTFENLFAAARILSSHIRVSGMRLAIISNGTAPAMMALERMEIKRFQVPMLGTTTLAQLNRKLGATLSGSNPLVLRKPDELAQHYKESIISVRQLDDIDAILVIFVPDSRNQPVEIAQALTQCLPSNKPILACWMGGVSVMESREQLSLAGIPNFRTPESAIDGFDFLHRYFISQQQLLQLPNPASRSTRADADAARVLVSKELQAGTRVLGPIQARSLLTCFDIDVPVEPMLAPDNPRYLTLSIFRDPTFGPVISVSAGDGLSALTNQRAVQLPPLNRYLIAELLDNVELQTYLGAYRQQPAVDKEPLAHVLRRLSELACELPDVFSLDINPLVLSENGAVAMDIHVVLEASPTSKHYEHLAIHPYPWNWIRQVTLKDGRSVTLRPIRPDDAQSINTLVREMSAESRYFRFMHAINELSPQMVAQFTKLDYDRQMAFVASHELDSVVGVSRYIISSDRLTGEFAISVSDQWKGLGLATTLMRLLIEHAQAQGLATLHGGVLKTNKPMQALMKSMGFTCSQDSTEYDVLLYTYPLNPST